MFPVHFNTAAFRRFLPFCDDSLKFLHGPGDVALFFPKKGKFPMRRFEIQTRKFDTPNREKALQGFIFLSNF